jgi:hypothetical protein
MKRHLFIALLLAPLGVARLHAQIQPAADAASQARQAATPELELLQPLDEATGRDLVLMQEHKAFFARLDQRLSWTDNALFSPTRVSDTYYSGSLALGFDTTTPGGIELIAEGIVNATRYRRNPAIDYNFYGGTVGIGWRKGGWRIAADYRPLQFTDRDFSNDLLFNHDYGVSLGYQASIGRTAGWFLNTRLSRVDSSPTDYDAWRVAPYAGLYCQARPWLFTSVGVAASFTDYDHYFTLITGQNRGDTLISPFLNVNFTPRPWLTVGTSMQYANNESSLAVSTYRGFTVTPFVQVRLRF